MLDLTRRFCRSNSLILWSLSYMTQREKFDATAPASMAARGMEISCFVTLSTSMLQRNTAPSKP
eukprot:scaffold3726_cov270-Pinguiococcus_pyrenoidosus.AAC.4